MVDKNKYIVDGYAFSSKEEMEEAKNELSGIEYLENRTDLTKVKNVYATYNKIIEKELFRTPLGYKFLKELQEILYQSNEIEDEDILPIPILKTSDKIVIKQRAPKVPKNYDLSGLEIRYKNKFINMIIFSVFLVIILVLMFLITNNSKNTNILNYKERIDREYSKKEDALVKWSEELSIKEKELEEMINK